MVGSSFDDTMGGSPGDDDLGGAGGTDTVTFATAGGPVHANLDTGLSTGDGADSLAGFENLTGSAFGGSHRRRRAERPGRLGRRRRSGRGQRARCRELRRLPLRRDGGPRRAHGDRRGRGHPHLHRRSDRLGRRGHLHRRRRPQRAEWRCRRRHHRGRRRRRRPRGRRRRRHRHVRGSAGRRAREPRGRDGDGRRTRHPRRLRERDRGPRSTTASAPSTPAPDGSCSTGVPRACSTCSPSSPTAPTRTASPTTPPTTTTPPGRRRPAHRVRVEPLRQLRGVYGHPHRQGPQSAHQQPGVRRDAGVVAGRPADRVRVGPPGELRRVWSWTRTGAGCSG